MSEKLIIKSVKPEGCCYGSKGYPECHCNNCLEAIIEYDEFKKNKIYLYKGRGVTITSFCPFEHCCNIFIQGVEEPAFCEWLTLDKAKKVLKNNE